MRVLYLTEEPITFSGTMVRGGQIHVQNVAEGIRDRGHDVHPIDWNNKSEREYQHSIAPRSRFLIDPPRTLRRAVSVGDAIGADVIVYKKRKEGIIEQSAYGMKIYMYLLNHIKILLLNFPNRRGRYSSSQRVRWNIVGDNGACTDDCTLADCDAF